MNTALTRKALSELGLSPLKSLGQNFLVNPVAVRRIVNALGTVHGTVLEIGPGLGSLTNALLRAGLSVSAVEIYDPMVNRLKIEYPGLSIVSGDFLSIAPHDIPGYPFTAVASNLPYNISSQAVFRLCQPEYDAVDTAVLMFQKELAERLACTQGGRNYGRLSLLVWPWFSVERLFDLTPADFLPQPEVYSSVVRLKRKQDAPLTRKQYPLFEKIVRASFAGRRKKIVNSLSRVFGKQRSVAMLDAAGIDPGLRAERVSPEKFADLARKAAD